MGLKEAHKPNLSCYPQGYPPRVGKEEAIGRAPRRRYLYYQNEKKCDHIAASIPQLKRAESPKGILTLTRFND